MCMGQRPAAGSLPIPVADQAVLAQQAPQRRLAGALANPCSATRTALSSRETALNHRFGKVIRLAGIGHWHAHEGRHTAVPS